MSTGTVDLLLRNARLRGHSGAVDIAVRAGRIVAIGPALACASVLEEDAGGRLVLPGLVDTHIHLDKSCLLCRCGDAGGGPQGCPSPPCLA